MFFGPFSFSSSASERTAETWGLLILLLRFNACIFWSSCFMNQHSRSIYWTSIICHTLCCELRMQWFNRYFSIAVLQSSRIHNGTKVYMYIYPNWCYKGGKQQTEIETGRVSFFRWGDQGPMGSLAWSWKHSEVGHVSEPGFWKEWLPSLLNITSKILGLGECRFLVKGCRMCTDVKISTNN